MWRRALLRTMEEFKRNQQQFVMAGNVIPAGSAQYFESGRSATLFSALRILLCVQSLAQIQFGALNVFAVLC